MKTAFISIKYRLAAGFIFSSLLSLAVFLLAFFSGLNEGPAIFFSLLFAVLSGLLCGFFLSRPLFKQIKALEIGLLNLKDHEFSISLASEFEDEFSPLADLFNEISESLHRSRQSIYQRELLLDHVMESSPISVVLIDQSGKVVYSNHQARQLLNLGKDINGWLFEDFCRKQPQGLKEIINAGQDGLWSFIKDGEAQTYHLSQSRFTLHANEHKLYLLKHLTRELNREEVKIWKKVIRVISHELNNSIAPISSMTHSAKILSNTGRQEQLNEVFSSINTRIQHLNQFILSYARYAKLPPPDKKKLNWPNFLTELQQQVPFTIDAEIPDKIGFFDPGQIEQVLINLLKNAKEAGSRDEDIKLRFDSKHGFDEIQVLDRGQGMSSQVLENALLPFYSTKHDGTGLGLPLCKEIVEAHHGKLTLQARPGGGIKVSVFLAEPASSLTTKPT